MGLWLDIGGAIATKADTVSAIRQSTRLRTDARGPTPSFKVLEPSWQADFEYEPDAWQDFYQLVYPAELLIPRPSGRGRAAITAEDICKALRDAFSSGVHLGIPEVRHCALMSMEPRLDDFEETGLAGYRLSFLVRVREIRSTARTI